MKTVKDCSLTTEALEKLIKRCLVKAHGADDSIDHFIARNGLVHAAYLAAQCLWVEKVEDDEDTEMLRKQLLHFAHTNQLNIQGGEEK